MREYFLTYEKENLRTKKVRIIHRDYKESLAGAHPKQTAEKKGREKYPRRSQSKSYFTHREINKNMADFYQKQEQKTIGRAVSLK